MINFTSNFESVKKSAIQGAKLVNNVPTGKEVKLHHIGEHVCSTDLSPYKFKNGIIISYWLDNGYFYYRVNINGLKKDFRQKDIKSVFSK